jgi:hypothetical protein
MPVCIKRSRKARAVPVRARLRAKAADISAFDLDRAPVRVRRGDLDLVFAQSLERTLAEWASSVDDEAYRDL